ncbi:MAG TPA: hypothetical protein ENI32_00955 [Candidatus Syntrophoarchaeum butanivorans]|uniref:DNA replication complex GINS family protein n=1 Tax=Candidatus Syntropharchaeum butanivorans TaxID=1839936 RepID=A0A1F2P446_9EURY|nr:MAG: hypothetical protein SBU_001014 [Candidatus Syntrophoarchaeum butanivorans]HEC56447.1 hypothetical protein [Candidatus Syntrophoarchaeum butanivorans]
MDLGKLWRFVDDERSSSTLQRLPASVYDEIRRYIHELEGEIRELEGKRRMYLEDELRTARIKVEELFEKRIFKVAGLASSRLKQMPENLLPHEEDLYKDLVERIEALRGRVLGPILRKGEDEKSFIRGDDSIMDNFTIVRVLKDIPVFMGVYNGKSREYSLKKEDIVILPRSHAEGLCKKKVAIEVEIPGGEDDEDAERDQDALPVLQ